MSNACIFTGNVMPFARCKATAQFWCGLAPDAVGIPAVTINPASVLCDVAMSVDITPAHPATNATDPHENWTSWWVEWRSSPVLPMLTVGWLALFTCKSHAVIPIMTLSTAPTALWTGMKSLSQASQSQTKETNLGPPTAVHISCSEMSVCLT